MNILVIQGPNLNLLGVRKPEVYGEETLDEINSVIEAYATERGVTVTFFQSNHEGAIIDKIHALLGPASDDPHDALIINPGAYAHYSIAIRDAIEAVDVPTIEVHLSDIKKREAFRAKSVIEDVCTAQISGLGMQSYLRAIDRLTES